MGAIRIAVIARSGLQEDRFRSEKLLIVCLFCHRRELHNMPWAWKKFGALTAARSRKSIQAHGITRVGGEFQLSQKYGWVGEVWFSLTAVLGRSSPDMCFLE